MGNTLGAVLGDAVGDTLTGEQRETVGFIVDEQSDLVGFILVDGQQRDFVGSAYVDEQ